MDEISRIVRPQTPAEMKAEVRRLIAEIHNHHRVAYQREIEPLLAHLVHLENIYPESSHQFMEMMNAMEIEEKIDGGR